MREERLFNTLIVASTITDVALCAATFGRLALRSRRLDENEAREFLKAAARSSPESQRDGENP